MSYYLSFLCSEPEMKRTICKQCGLVMKPGISAKMTITDELIDKSNECLIKCLKCDTSKRFVIKDKYNLWLDRPEAISEIIQPSDGPEK